MEISIELLKAIRDRLEEAAYRTLPWCPSGTTIDDLVNEGSEPELAEVRKLLDSTQ